MTSQVDGQVPPTPYQTLSGDEDDSWKGKAPAAFPITDLCWLGYFRFSVFHPQDPHQPCPALGSLSRVPPFTY